MNTKKVLTNSFVYVVLGFLAPAVNFFLLPFYVKELSAAEFGIITLATLVQSVLINIIGLGLSGAYNRFFFDVENEPNALNRLFSTALISQIVSGLFVWGLGMLIGDSLLKLVFQDRRFTYESYGTLITFTAIAYNLQVAIMAGYRNKGKVGAYAFWSILFFSTVAVSIFYGIVILKEGAIGSVAGRMIGTCLPVLAYLIFYFWNHPIRWSKMDLKKMLRYGLPLVPYLLLGLAFASVDKWIIERKFSLDILGIYGFGFLIASIAEIFINAIQSAFYPSLFRALRDSRGSQESMQIKRIFKTVAWVVFLMMTSLIAWSGPVIELFIDKKYGSVLDFLPLLCLTYIPRVFFTIYGTSIMYYNRTRVLPLINGLAFVTALLTGWWLAPLMGLFGVILALFLSQFVQLLAVIFFSARQKIIIPETLQLKQEWLTAIIITLVVPVLLWLVNRLHFSYYVFLILWLAIVALAFQQFIKMYPQLIKHVPLLSGFNFRGRK